MWSMMNGHVDSGAKDRFCVTMSSASKCSTTCHPHGLDPRDQAVEDVEVGDAAQMLDEIEANTANTPLMEALQFMVRHRVVDAGDASVSTLTSTQWRPRSPPCPCHGNWHGTITARATPRVGRAACAEFQRGRREACSCGPAHRGSARRAEDMTVRVAGAGRQASRPV